MGIRGIRVERLLIIVMGFWPGNREAQCLLWGPPLTSSLVSASLVFGHPSHPENMGFIRIGLSSLFGVTRKQLRCLWIMFLYSLWSCIPDPLHHMDNNTPVCMTQALYTSVCSHGVWLSIQQPLQPPAFVLLSVSWKPKGSPLSSQSLPPVTGAPYPSCRLWVGWRGQGKLRTVGQWPPQLQCPIDKFYHTGMIELGGLGRRW